MQKTIKLAYDWYAPEFPLNNNQSSFGDAIEKARKIIMERLGNNIQSK